MNAAIKRLKSKSKGELVRGIKDLLERVDLWSKGFIEVSARLALIMPDNDISHFFEDNLPESTLLQIKDRVKKLKKITSFKTVTFTFNDDTLPMVVEVNNGE